MGFRCRSYPSRERKEARFGVLPNDAVRPKPGGTLTYSYSPGGRLDTLTDWASRVSSYTYYASGLVNTISVPGGMTTTNQYDRAQRITSLTNIVGSTTITSHVYTCEVLHQRGAVTFGVEGVTAPSRPSRSASPTTV
jgi:uncharacterized protein RhaS with RHS repeats